MDTLHEIERYLAQYFERGSSMGINELLDIQDKISIHSYRLAEKTAQIKSEYNGRYFIRKIEVNKATQALINKGKSKAAASIEAETDEEIKDLIKSELDAESEAYKLDLILGQVNRVLSAIAQRVSYLKSEKKDFHA